MSRDRLPFLVSAFSFSVLPMLASAACVVLWSVPVPANADTAINSNITADTTWSATGSPFIVGRSVAINAGVTLTIEPGVVVKFSQQAAALVVNGTLEATGTGDSLIYFTSFKDDAAGGDTNGDGTASAPSAGDWREIQVNPGGVANLTYAVITYGGANVCCLQSNADVYNHGGTLSIASSTIAYATTFGIKSGPGTTTIIASTIAHTPVGIPVGGSGITVRDSLFTGNTSYPMVINNIIDFTHSGNRAVGNAHDGFLLGTDFVADETLPPEGASYIINGVTIPAGKTLTFEPGAVVKFLSPTSYLLVNGTLNVAGTSDAPVVLTSYADDTGWDTNGDGSASAPAPGNWKHVQVGPGGTADIAYAHIRYGGADVCCLPSLADVGNRGGMLAITDSVITNGATYGIVTSSFGTTTVSRSEIAYNRQGFALGSGSASLSSSSVHDNSLYGASNAAATSSLSIAGNYWGDPTGPSYWLNPGGLGNKVGSRVDPYPWLQSDPATEPPAEPACTENCNDNILFLPGIEASRLYRPDYNGGTDKLWEPSSDADAVDLALDTGGESVRNDIYTKDLVGEAYGTLNIYKSFLADLSAWKGSGLFADYAAVPYDWRLSLTDILNYGNDIDGRLYYSGDLRATSTPYIIQELRRMADTSRSGKVTIIAHSNGGLVAKALIKQLEDSHDPLADKIDKLILVAVPQTGTPAAIGALLHGFRQGIPRDSAGFLLSPEAARTFAENAPMVYHLLPSGAYFSGPGADTQTPVITFVPGTTTARFIATYGASITTPSSLASFLAGADGRSQPDTQDLVNPAKAQPGLLGYGAAEHARLDAWVPPASMQVYQIAGWGEDTVAGITYANDSKCVERHLLRCTRYEDVLRYTPNAVVDGDGTVAVSSALAMSTSSANVSRWWVDLGKYNSENTIQSGFFGRTHSNILEVPELREFIAEIMKSSSVSQFVYVLPTMPVAEKGARLEFILHSPLSMSATDSAGNDVNAELSNIPDARYRRFGEVQYISVPTEAHPTLHLAGQEAGSFTLEVFETHGNTVVASTTFEGIPVATTSSATMQFADGTITGASPLSVDVDGDSAPDVSLQPLLDGTTEYAPPKLPLTVTADNKTMVIGDAMPPLTATLSGFASGDTALSSVTGTPSCDTTQPVTGIGTYNIVCSAGTLASEAYLFDNFATGTLTVVYAWGGFSQPINDTAYSAGQSTSVFKAGSTVPVKFQLTDATGHSVQASSSPVWLSPTKGAAMSAPVGESTYSDPGTSGAVYKWDSTAQQYIYNWSTKGLAAGYWYRVYAKLDDGKIYSVVVGLR